MKILYNIALYSAEFLIKILAFFNDKIRLGVEGRNLTFWFHCASLGEYEQGLPIFKQLRAAYPHHKVVLTFFSPSGYEIRKNTPVADVVVYLPMDTPANAKRFIKLVNPELSIFVKYDIWPNYLSQLRKRNLRCILISAVFRKEQPYFKFYGAMMVKALKTFEHIFVQDESSKNLLQTIQIDNVTVAGDTRYDRVSDQLRQDNNLPFIERFKNGKLCVVLGSSWPEDEALFVDYINSLSSKDIKFIIAPHNIKTQQISQFTEKIQKRSLLFSEKAAKNLADYEVFIVDTIGLLSKIYSYADIAYVGGAMGQTGLHNILEPAVFGVPIIIGKNYKKFPEAFQMITHAGVISINNAPELKYTLNELLEDFEKRQHLGALNEAFIIKNTGAVVLIMAYIRT